MNNERLISKGSSLQKIKGLNGSEEKEEVILSNARREENTCLKPPWTKLKGKKENIRGTFKDKEIHLVHKLCMHDAIML